MPCPDCDNLKDVDEALGPYTVHVCKSCGRSIRSRTPGDHGIGFRIERGQQVVIPKEWLKIAANPLKSTGTLSGAGLQWFAEMVFLDHSSLRPEDPLEAIQEQRDKNEIRLKEIATELGIDTKDTAWGDTVLTKLNEDRSNVGFWIGLSDVMANLAEEAIAESDAGKAAWAMAMSERLRALTIYMDHYAAVVEMGHSARRLIDLIKLWDANKENGDEEFWHIKLSENSLALSQIFAAPVTYIQGKAYVGGQTIANNSARLADFLFAGGSGDEAIIIEIKTPKAKLVRGGKYRTNVYAASSELAGSVVQVADYRRTLSSNFEQLRGNNQTIQANAPRAVVIIGNSSDLNSAEKRRSFELFRSSLMGIEVLTFDEVFRKIEILAGIFGLSRKSS